MGKERNKREMEFLYNKTKSDERSLLPYVDAISFKVKTVDVSSEKVTATQLGILCSELHNGTEDLVNRTIPPFDKQSPSDFSHEDLLTVLVQNPELINTPIALTNNSVIPIKGQQDIMGMDKAFDSNDQ